MIQGTNYVITIDGKIEEEADRIKNGTHHPFEEVSSMYFIPDILAAHIREQEDNPRCSFCKKTKKEAGTPVIEGKNANICYGCIAINKKKLDKEGKK